MCDDRKEGDVVRGKEMLCVLPQRLDHTLYGICQQLGMTGNDIIDQIIVVWKRMTKVLL